MDQLNKLLDKELQCIKDSKDNFEEDIFLQNYYKFLEDIFLLRLSEKKQEVFEIFQIHKNR